VNHKNATYPFLFFWLLAFSLAAPLKLSAQKLIKRVENRIESKANRLGSEVKSRAKGSARMKVNSSKRSLKSSLKGGRKGGGVNTDPTLDQLIKDPEVKTSLKDNTNKQRYIELFGQWMSMPNDAQLAAEAKIKAFQDSIAAIDVEKFRVTKKIWDGSRDMTIFGWHPHWMGNLYKGYNYNLLNVISYYSYDINPIDGSAQNPDAINKLLGSDFVQTAQANGCSALLSISCHGVDNVMQFLDQNPVAQRTAIDSILYVIDSVNADGVEINFIGVNEVVKDDFYKFVRILSNTLTSVRGDTSFVLMSVPPYDEANIYDIAKLQDYVDLFIVKGYDFQETPDGLKQMPPAPYNYSPVSPDYDLRSAVEKYIANIGPYYSDRIILALPYYGTMWKTDGITEEVLDMSMLTYSDIQFDFVEQRQDSFKYPGARLYFDSTKTTYVFNYKEYWDGINIALGDVPHEINIYFEDTLSLRKKYQFIAEYRLGGVGIQSLGYDSGFRRLNEVLKEEFTTVEMPTDDVFKEVNARSQQARNYGIYFLVVLLYLAIFMSIGFCAALFQKSIRQALFDSGRFRLMYLGFFTLLMLILGYYMGLFESATMPLVVGIVFGGLVSWTGWRLFSKQKSRTP